MNLRKPLKITFILVCVFNFAAPAQEKPVPAAQKIKEQDWAALKFYQQANRNADLEHPKENRVVLMGNSITQLWQRVDSNFFKAHKNYINRGISGQTTPQMLLRFRQDVINLKPRILVLLGGTNDLAGNTGPATVDEIFGNLVSMMELARTNGIKVVICSVLPVYDYPWRKGLEPVEKIARLNELLQKYAKEQQLVYLDYYQVMKDERKGMKADLSGDGVHPNLKGYQLMEPLLVSAVAAAGKNKK
jgi:lysophospholipase L1-like esterase